MFYQNEIKSSFFKYIMKNLRINVIIKKSEKGMKII